MVQITRTVKNLLPEGAVRPVSYTHLDVYKRQAVRRCVEAGYRRVKLKVAPGGSLSSVQAVREAYPRLMITLDANQSFAEHDLSLIHI